MKIRKFRKKDSDICSRIIYDCITVAKKMNKKEKELLKDFYTPEKIIKLSEKSDFFVVQKNKQLIGTGRLEKNKIATLYIEPEYQRKGIGTLIVNRLIKRARRNGFKKVYVEALLQSVGFYEKNGFKKVRILQKPIRAYKMEKS